MSLRAFKSALTILLALGSPDALGASVSFADDFESGGVAVDGVPAGRWEVFRCPAGCSVEALAAAAHRGAFGMRAAEASTGGGAQAYAAYSAQALNPSALFFRAWIRVTPTVQGRFNPIVITGTGTNPTLVNVAVAANGTWETGGSDLSLGWSSEVWVGAPALGWHLLELALEGVGTSGARRRAWLDGALVADRPGLDFTGIGVREVRVGVAYDEGVFQGSVDLDDIRLSSVPPASRLRMSSTGPVPPGACHPVQFELVDSVSGSTAASSYDVDLELDTSEVGLYSNAGCSTSTGTRLTSGQHAIGLFLRALAGTAGDVALRARHPDFLQEPLTLRFIADGTSPPVARLTAQPSAEAAPTSVTLDATGSTLDPASGPWRYRFALGDEAIEGPDPTWTTPVKTPGGVVARVTVTDALGRSSVAQTTIAVRDSAGATPPTAVIAAVPLQGPAPLAVSLSRTASPGSAGILASFWRIDGGPPRTEPALEETFSLGRHRVELVVIAEDGTSARDAIEIVAKGVEGEPPTCRIRATPTAGAAPLVVQWSVEHGSAPISSSWWLDGVRQTSMSRETRYPEPGAHRALLSATFEDGAVCTATAEGVVLSTTGERPVRILDLPIERATCGEAYSYGPLGHPLVEGTAPIAWSLAEGPEGLSVDAASGALRWTPTRKGVHPIVLVARNGAGKTELRYELVVECGEDGEPARPGAVSGCGCGVVPAGLGGGLFFLAFGVNALARASRRSRNRGAQP